MADLVQRELEVPGKLGSYTFRLPTLYEDMRISARAKEIRKLVDPAWDGFEAGLDSMAQMSMRASAVFDISLIRANVTWPYTPDGTGKPVVDSSKFDETVAYEVLDVYRGYVDKVDRFRATGSAEPKPVGAESVEGQPDSPDVAVPG